MIAIGSDHAGYGLKQKVMEHLKEQGLEFKDYGTYSEASCDYPDFAETVARAVADGTADRGVLICGTGVGMSIAANKIKGIRAGVCTDATMARLIAAHNDANILCLGERIVGPELAKDILSAYLSARFEGGRHAKRVDKIREIEKRG